MERRFDFHTHSTCSDGTDTPTALVAKAKDCGITFLALTDHDCIDGYHEAAQAGREQGLAILPGIEMDNEFPEELHILGLGVEPDHPALAQAVRSARMRRDARNVGILKRLKDGGMDITEDIAKVDGILTRSHFARALRDAGFAANETEAFTRYLSKASPYYYTVERLSPKQVIETIHHAGGLAVLAHPCRMHCDMHQLVPWLVDLGLDGIEAYYATATAGQRQLHLSLAAQYKLVVTAGSDYHGAERKQNPLGSAYADVPLLHRTYDIFLERLEGRRR